MKPQSIRVYELEFIGAFFSARICISTILDSFNFYSKLMELKDENGDNFFVVHEFVPVP